jgi:hypothetical protein
MRTLHSGGGGASRGDNTRWTITATDPVYQSGTDIYRHNADHLRHVDRSSHTLFGAISDGRRAAINKQLHAIDVTGVV